eukprot:COSAG02_NODE_225_length_28184_cov_16.570981_13_plen_487_part_00
MSSVDEERTRGNDSFRAGRYVEAEEHYTAAMLLARAAGQSADHRLFSNRAAARLHVGDLEGALADARECVAVCPSFSKGHFRAGQALERLGRYAAAREAYSDGITAVPAAEARELAKALAAASPAGCTDPTPECLGTCVHVCPQKGRITIATRDFSPGETIMAETPLLDWASPDEVSGIPNFFRAFGAASPATREAVAAMYDEPNLMPGGPWGKRGVLMRMVPASCECTEAEMLKLIGVEATNAHSFGGEEQRSALFARGSLISHSCLPNAAFGSHSSPGKQIHTAIRQISKGDEVTVSYGVGFGKDALWSTPTPQRQKFLLDTKGFDCKCERCVQADLPQAYYDYVQPMQRSLSSADITLFDKTGEQELAATFRWIRAAECAAAGCPHWAAENDDPALCSRGHCAMFELQKPAFHAGEAFVKLYGHAKRSPAHQESVGRKLNPFYAAVKKYQPVVAQWLGAHDPDYKLIDKALRGFKITSMFDPR